MINKKFIVTLSVVYCLSSCYSYTGSGAYTGAQLGSMIGSAIGGITGGWRGSDLGTIVGMAGGAAIGAAVGAKADQKVTKNKAETSHKPAQSTGNAKHQRVNQADDGYDVSADTSNSSGFNPTGSGDDRLYNDVDINYSGDYIADTAALSQQKTATPGNNPLPYVEILGVEMVEIDNDKTLHRGETCEVKFEIYNAGHTALTNVKPFVVEKSGNNHLHFSPMTEIRRFESKQRIRYTALLKADKKIKKGVAVIAIWVNAENNKTVSKVYEFSIQTSK